MNPFLANDDAPTIYLRGVSKAYRRGAAATMVLDEVDLTVRRGECAFLAGPSGSGKTTLLSILGCILAADRGRVELFGQDLAALRPPERTLLRRDRIGFVFQRFHLIRGLTALENVCVPMTLRGVAARTSRTRARELLQAVGLGQLLDADPRNLSAGQCQQWWRSCAYAVPTIRRSCWPTSRPRRSTLRTARK